MYDIFFVSKTDVCIDKWKEFNKKYPSSIKIDNVETIDDIKSKSFTKMFWIVWDDLILSPSFDLNEYRTSKWDDMYVHVFKNGDYYDGICLFPKILEISQKEFDYRFFVNKKEIDIVISYPRPYDIFYIDSYIEYLDAKEKSTTEMFWVVWNDLVLDKNFNFDYRVQYHNKNITHIFKNGDYFDGICLFSKTSKISKREFDHRFFTDKKEINITASKPKPYDIFYIDSYIEYLDALEKSSTEMFWVVWNEIEIIDNSIFDLYFSHHNIYDRSENHVFKHIFRKQDTYANGIILFSKLKKVSKKEIDHRFLIEKKEHNRVASKFKSYDIVFISYNEPNADINYQKLLKRFPNAKRVDKVKGIHQAHIQAATIVDSEMFWVVDGDAEILDDFTFEYELSTYDRDTVYVWKSQNPINNLIYGYGGVKLLPKKLTLNMNVDSPDMTTAISKKFKSIDDVSNITAFNTDPFNTWKSAFRECVKLSTKIIDRQNDKETEDRLNIWCSIGEDQPYGKYAIAGAVAGSEFGKNNKDDINKIKKINDFDWLREYYEQRTKNIHP
jgi:hypothetical protein